MRVKEQGDDVGKGSGDTARQVRLKERLMAYTEKREVSKTFLLLMCVALANL